MRKYITLVLLMLSMLANAEFTVAMYKNLKAVSISQNSEESQKARHIISTYLMGIASGANEISHFESIKNGTPFPYCLPKGTRLTPSFAEYVVDSLLEDNDAKLENTDSMPISRVYVIGILRYYRCNQ